MVSINLNIFFYVTLDRLSKLLKFSFYTFLLGKFECERDDNNVTKRV
jgi:hypothetical protein